MITRKMIQAAKAETQEQQSAQWTPARIAGMRADALISANELHTRRWGVQVPALVAAIAAAQEARMAAKDAADAAIYAAYTA